ncbi:hypothetical protein LTR66_001822 [Elasticomyces elasticus]|nr:hypothetical protein LTR66_001822 [Elasticomyces elasticus]
MADLTPTFAGLLQSHDVPYQPFQYDVAKIDSFLQEAYNINSRITELTNYLHTIRSSYLSLAPPSRRTPHTSRNGKLHLTDSDREAIDAQSKQILREVNAAITQLAQAEQIRQETEDHVSRRRRAKAGFGALGRWAGGGSPGVDGEKSPKEHLEADRRSMLKMHREGVIWYLQRGLEEAGALQGGMMEVRLQRELEKSKSILYKSRNAAGRRSAADDVYSTGAASGVSTNAQRLGRKSQEETDQSIEDELSQEQLQLFAEENHDMLKHHEDRLDQVRQVEQSLLSISELQSQIASNLATQQTNLDQLVQDSYMTTENVGSGNKELKRASERRSTARLLFWSTCGFCSFLIVWDLIF